MDIVDDISPQTVKRVLKNDLRPHLRKQWSIGQITSAFIWHMEEVLDIYEQDYNPKRPVICFDKRPGQLIDAPIHMKKGQVLRQDYHYKGNGRCCVLIAIEPLTGKRIVAVKERKRIMLIS